MFANLNIFYNNSRLEHLNPHLYKVETITVITIPTPTDAVIKPNFLYFFLTLLFDTLLSPKSAL